MAILKDLIVNGDSRIIGNETAESFIKNGGTSAQFLKADGSVDSNIYATTSSLANKQDKLVSGTNIKTINNNSILGSGNIDIAGAFIATYGTTTLSEITAALTAGKPVIAKKIDAAGTSEETTNYYPNLIVAADTYIFSATINFPAFNVFATAAIYINSTGWHESTGALIENSENKVTSLTTSSTDTQYPSARVVYNAIGDIEAALDAILTGSAHGGDWEVDHSGGENMVPNKMYDLGTLTGTVTFSLAESANQNVVNHYYWTFDTISPAPTITWPTGVTWENGNVPTLNVNKHYEISVNNNVGTYMEV